MTRRFAALNVVSCCVSLLTPAVCTANVVFTNFQTGSAYNTSVGSPVGNYFDGNNYAEGSTFTPSANATFGSLRIALSCAFTCPASSGFTVALNRDNGDQPGISIESFAGSDALLGSIGNNGSPILFNSTQQSMLMAGTQYWITVASDANSSIAWNFNAAGDSSDQAISIDGGASWFSPSGQTPGAYEVDSAATPEPELLGALGFGFAILWVWRRIAHRPNQSSGALFAVPD